MTSCSSFHQVYGKVMQRFMLAKRGTPLSQPWFLDVTMFLTPLQQPFPEFLLQKLQLHHQQTWAELQLQLPLIRHLPPLLPAGGAPFLLPAAQTAHDTCRRARLQTAEGGLRATLEG